MFKDKLFWLLLGSAFAGFYLLHYSKEKTCKEMRSRLYLERQQTLSEVLSYCNTSHPNFGCIVETIELNRALTEQDNNVLKTEGCI